MLQYIFTAHNSNCGVYGLGRILIANNIPIINGVNKINAPLKIANEISHSKPDNNLNRQVQMKIKIKLPDISFKKVFINFSNLSSENFVRILLYIFTGLIIISSIFFFYKISKSTESINFAERDWTENGFELFLHVYKFPLYLIGVSIPIIGMMIAYLRYCQFSESLRLTRQSFDADYRPFITGESITYDKNTKELKFNSINFGKYPAKIYWIHFDYKEPTKNRMASLSRKLIIVFPGEPKKYIFEMSKGGHDKIVDEWFKNNEHTEIHIEIKYQGLNKFEYKTNEIWRLNTKEQQFELINTDWK